MTICLPHYTQYIFYLEWIEPQSLPHMYHEPRPTAVLKKTYLVVMHSSEFHQ
jgi:hypothetical protein